MVFDQFWLLPHQERSSGSMDSTTAPDAHSRDLFAPVYFGKKATPCSAMRHHIAFKTVLARLHSGHDLTFVTPLQLQYLAESGISATFKPCSPANGNNSLRFSGSRSPFVKELSNAGTAGHHQAKLPRQGDHRAQSVFVDAAISSA